MSERSNVTVGELALGVPEASRLFEKYGIDYCCGGRRSLEDACTAAGIRVDDLLRELDEKAEHLPPSDYQGLNQNDLIDHIVGTHHAFTREELSRLAGLIRKVCAVHESRHAELAEVRKTFWQLSDDLLPHMMKEENVLFPYIAALEHGVENKAPTATPPFGTVRNPVRMMTIEHETAGALLRKLRRLTSGYVVPSDACTSYRTLYGALSGLESDLHQHIHLENNVLFPRALRHEEQLREGVKTLA
jgi:regulator of cell morphogenesis and NO signaling